MTLDYYRIFYYVAQYQSFSKAAEILGNNQPNLSRCMNLLESELGCKLLVRTNRGVSLTPEGQRLFEHVYVEGLVGLVDCNHLDVELDVGESGQRTFHYLLW